MYKTLVRSHFDYCDVIYHNPSKQDQFGGILNSLMEKAEESSTKQHLLLLAHGKVLITLNSVMNWAGNPYLIDVGVGEFYSFIRYE